VLFSSSPAVTRLPISGEFNESLQNERKTKLPTPPPKKYIFPDEVNVFASHQK